MLLDFLQKQRESEQKGVTLEAVRDAQVRLVNAYNEHEGKCDKRWEKHEDEHRSLEHRQTAAESSIQGIRDRFDDSQRFNTEAIRLATARRDSGKPPVVVLGERPSIRPSIGRSIGKLVGKVIDHAVGKAALLVAAVVLGWLLRHLGVAAPAATIDAGKVEAPR